MDVSEVRAELDRFGLVYSADNQPGIARRARGRGFSYLMPDGTSIDDPAERARIASLAIPPAYRNVWICPLPEGHLQATGFDDRKRKQYRYHPEWSVLRSRRKFSELVSFGHALPRIRRRLAADLQEGAGSKTFALAALVTLIDAASLRVGSEEYLEENGTYGAATLQRRHVRLENGLIRLNYRGKGGKRVRSTLRDRRLHRVLDAIDDLPGRNLFVYVDEAGTVRDVDSTQVNHYLAEISDCPGITAKTFRTWAGTLAAYDLALDTVGPSIKAMTSAAAERLHNTPAICRSSYVHPAVLQLSDATEPEPQPEPGPRGLRLRENALLSFLETRADPEAT